MSSKGVRTNTRNLGDGWIMDCDSITSTTPVQPSAPYLGTFYKNLMEFALDQLSKSSNSTDDLVFRDRNLNLRLSSAAPISWT